MLERAAEKVVSRATRALAVLSIAAAAASSAAACAVGLREASPGDDASAAGDFDPGQQEPSTPVGPGCTGDLQHVVAEDGTVTACPPDEGCFDAACVPACDAAAQSRGAIGCDYVLATPSFNPFIAPPCYAVFVANAWSKPVHLELSRGGAALDLSEAARTPVADLPPEEWPPVGPEGVQPNEVAVVFLSSDPTSGNPHTDPPLPMTCPVPPAIPAGTSVHETGRGEAFHLRADAPIVAYDILPFGGASSFLPSAQLLLPTSAWGKTYVAVLPPMLPSLSIDGPQWAQIVAAEDDTTVTIAAKANLPGGPDMDASPYGEIATFHVGADQYLQWQPHKQDGLSASTYFDITGSVIQSDKPILFVGGNGYLCGRSETSEGGGCDTGHLVVPPLSGLGSEYVAAPYATRRADLAPESIPYRLVGTVDGTALSYEPAVAGAPAELGAGEVVSFESTAAFRVTSQDGDHPFYVGQLMPGCTVTGGSRPAVTWPNPSNDDCLGDEEFVGVLPPAQFLDRYVFFTDPSYATTNLVLTRARTTSGFQDVAIDCLGIVGGWRPVGVDGLYETTDVDLQRGEPVGSCKSGQHVAQSSAPFGLVVWGLDSYSSYAYPAGGNVAVLNAVVIEPPK